MKYLGYRILNSKHSDGKFNVELIVLQKNESWKLQGWWPFQKHVCIKGDEYESLHRIYDDEYPRDFPSVEAAIRYAEIIINPDKQLVKEVRLDRPETPD